MMDQNAHFNDPVLNHVRKDFSLLQDKLTVQEAFEVIRQKGVGEKIIYFYVTDESGKLTGVLPTRRLLISQPDTQISEIMVSRVVAIPSDASVLDACEFFVLYKYLAFPVIDKEHHIVGVVDISLFAEELLDAPDPRQLDDVFEAIGFRITQVRHASPFMAWRYRFPWLLTTIASGTACALLAGMYETTLAQSLVLAFFLTLVLGLGESLSIQSMTMTIQSLHTIQPTLK
ncbi:MAG: magnesium transporter, partial [Desulfobulbaceae bacterium]|nr:magnesium transporter [Desulfobulbaceae bacterium]